ncbi:N-acetyltransferase eso1 [Coemansia thaxteri]|uniref:DNA polymerase eta n=1 Tax=Coemansia thaxteri TaxID=2663907 RepID=A0A9W8BQ52_9FUNG|nr:N-acetyltransferase eso1 [Coemansia thaxteri]
MTVSEAYRQLATEELARSRAIIHIDLGKYSWSEQLRLGISPDVPLAVQQWQGLIAVNYPARAQGVKRHDTVTEARKKCPDIRFVHVATFTDTSPPAYHPSPSATTHKASLDEYRRASRRIMDVVRRLCPTMDKASIDEAYLDASEIVKDSILRDFACGRLEWASSDDAELADDAFNGASSNIEPPAMLPTPAVRWSSMSRKGKEREPADGFQHGSTEYGILVGDVPPVSYGWGDLQLKYAAQFAIHVRNVILQELGYRSSAGVAHNKLLAKVGSAQNKPNMQTVILPSQVELFMQTFPLASLPSLGGKLGALVEAAFDAHMVGDIMSYTVEQLAYKLGNDQAMQVYNKCHAIDDSEVVDKSELQTLTSTKSFMRFPVTSLSQLERWLSINATDLWMRTAEEWELHKRWPRSLTIGYTTKGASMRSKTVPFPSRHVPSMRHSPDAITNVARACLEKIASGNAGPDSVAHETGRTLPTSAGLFPLIGFTLTAKAFQREMANTTLMEKWLSKPRAVQAEIMTNDQPLASTANEESETLPTNYVGLDAIDSSACDGELPGNSVPESCSSDMSSPASSSDILHIPDPPLPPHNTASMFGLTAGQVASSIATFSNATHSRTPMLPAGAASSSTNYTHAPLTSSVGAPSAAPTPPLIPSGNAHLGSRSGVFGEIGVGDGYTGAPWADSMRPPPLVAAPGLHSGHGMGSEYDSSDSDMSCLRTPQETDSEESGDAEDDLDSDAVMDGDAEADEGESSISGGTDAGERQSSEAGIEGGSAATPLQSSPTLQSPETNPGRKSSAALKCRSAPSVERRRSDDGTDNDPGPPSRATTVSSRRRTTGVYIQQSADMETASRYGEGYKHMNIDQHDDGSLVVASPEEVIGTSDGFIPALIAATRRKREIQIFRFQNHVDAPEGAISGTLSAANASSSQRGGLGSAMAGTSRAASIRHSRNSSTSTSAGPESSFMATVRSKLEQNRAAAIAEEDEAGDLHAGGEPMGNMNCNDSSDDEPMDVVLDIAVSAMMESISTSQAVMQIRCPQCPDTEPTISSLEWETHRDWHIARYLQERELRHDEVVQQLQHAFPAASSASSGSGDNGSVASSVGEGRPASKKAKLDKEQKWRQQTINESWK